ncbi:TPA: hypothetical protein ACH3X2_14305 [Trebouxia sp. C0005]|nr:MAG: hypothetical protein FRX49_06490 [Trebouxia sp. A1-2]
MERQRPFGILASTLRSALQAVNVVLAVTGVTMLGYAAYMYVDYEHITFSTDQSLHTHPRLLDWVIKAHRHGSPWFIYAFGGAGLFLFLTAISGLYGACYSNRHCLNFYSTMVVVMLLAQCALLVGYFADQSWKKKLPHDDTGEAAKIEKFVEKDLSVIKWVALGAFIIQVLSVLLACWLTSVQKAELEAAESEEEDEIWGRRRPLLQEDSQSTEALRNAEAAQAGPSTVRNDPWSIRMREKYGLDTSQFSYDPTRAQQSQESGSGPTQGGQAAATRRCTIM